MTHRWVGPLSVLVVMSAALLFFQAQESDISVQQALPPRAEVPPLPPLENVAFTKALEEPISSSDEVDEGQPDLALLATTVSRSAPERNRAHIHDRGRRSRYVMALDQLAPGYQDLRLVAIDDGRVLFDKAGQKFELFMDPDASFPPDPTLRPEPVTLTELVDLMGQQKDDESDEEYLDRYEHGLGKLYRMDLGLRTNKALFEQGVFAPKKKDGRQVGFYASRINKGSFWDTLGLRAGDVILEVNGIPIDGPESNRDAAKEIMRSETQIQLLVERDGETFETSTSTLAVNSGVWSDEDIDNDLED